VLHIPIKQIGDRPRSAIVGEFDAAAFLDEVCEVPLKHLARGMEG
jgi:hypothetical protein